jgi:hypothetical protein
VWGDSSADDDVATTAGNSFVVRCNGGATFYSDYLLRNSAVLAHGDGCWSTCSDRDAKENFERVDTREVLEKLVATPVATWNYKAQGRAIRHIGVVAQDFYANFKVGGDEKRITTVDADGVAMAAIQGLYGLVKAKESRISSLEKELAELRSRVAAQEASAHAWEGRFAAMESALQKGARGGVLAVSMRGEAR